MSIKNIFNHDLVLMHGWSKVGSVPTFFWRQGNCWLGRLHGITMEVKRDPQTNSLFINAEPVYAPFVVIEKHTGQIVIDIHAWTSSCVTVVLNNRKPWIWFTFTSQFLYKKEEGD